VNSTPTTRAALAPLLALLLAATGCTSGGTCESSALCGDGELCFEGRCVASLPAGTCTPPTLTPTLTTGTITASVPAACSSSGNPSTWPQPVAATASGWVTDLGTHTVGETVTFNVPPGTASVTIHQQGVSAAATFEGIPNSVVPTALRAPNGATVYDDFDAPVVAQPILATGYYAVPTPWAGSYTLPATSRILDLALSGGQIPPGDWSFQVNDWNAECGRFQGCYPSPTSGTYDITVVARPGPYVSTGTLDVGIYLAGGTLSASAAAADPGYRRFVRSIGEVLGRAGICLGTVTFFDLPTSPLSSPRYDMDPPCSDLTRLFSLASPAVDGVHLFLVDELCALDPLGNVDCNTGVIGIDGSIPGPSGLPGAATSGAAMVMGDIGIVQGGADCTTGPFDLARCGSDYSAYVAAHEIGHWLGLYHVTEAAGSQFDPIAETPTCLCTACAPQAAIPGLGYSYRDLCNAADPNYRTAMHPAWCMAGGETCGGGDNLMFWVVVPDASVGNLSPQQALVMRVNPAVK
jgi:hypothetical protein